MAASSSLRQTCVAALIAVAVSGCALISSSGEAEARSYKKAKRTWTVTSCSRWGNGCQTLPVRRGRFGYEARAKGGTWIDCRGDCDQAVREDIIDFWETQNDRAKAAR